MIQSMERIKVLIAVMTYPHPSRLHRELVCTAGITEDRTWVRLYPIDYRYRPRGQQFHKYQWIEVDLGPRGSGNDRRRESRRPDLDSIRVLGPPIGTSGAWRERRAIIDPMPHHTLDQLHALYDSDRISLGIVRPSRVLDLEVTPDRRRWKPAQEQALSQMALFGPPPKPLRRIPFKFRYVFECEDSTRAYRAMIEDWELGTLFLHEAERLCSDSEAAESVKTKFLNEICRNDKDTRFFMGTTFPYNEWVVIGTFWPPREYQTGLALDRLATP